MTPRHDAARIARRHAVVPLAAVALAATAACSGSPAVPPPAPTAASSTVAPSGSPSGSVAPASCVADPQSVIATPPTAEMTTAALPAALVSALDAAGTSSFEQAAAPGAIVGVRTPQGTWTKAYGVADPATDAPMTVGMHTRIGSVTKTFTGTALLQLVQQGKVSLDDPIGKYVAGVPNGDQVNLRQLADMTSGVASYTLSTRFTDVLFARPQTVFRTDDLIDIGIAESPLFPPGEKFNYSNTNTMLLGKVIEKVTGQPLGATFQKTIFGPLGMDNTSSPGTSTAMPKPYAQGFTLQGDTATADDPSNATSWNPSWAGAAGELISDMGDLLTYGRALGTGQGLVDAATQTERLRSFPGAAGYGIAMGCVGGWVGHTGELPGYNTAVYYDTSADSTVIVQTNSDIASGDCPDSPTLTDDPREAVCSSPATRMFVALSTALGHTFTPNPQR